METSLGILDVQGRHIFWGCRHNGGPVGALESGSQSAMTSGLAHWDTGSATHPPTQSNSDPDWLQTVKVPPTSDKKEEMRSNQRRHNSKAVEAVLQTRTHLGKVTPKPEGSSRAYNVESVLIY